MAKIHLNISENIFDDIVKKLRKINSNPKKTISANDITREAISVYKWTVDQIHLGNDVISLKNNKIETFVTPNIPSRKKNNI